MTEQVEAFPMDANHPDDEEMELVPDKEIDELVKDVDPSAPILTGEDDEE